MRDSLPKELSFIDAFRVTADSTHSASWLINSFDDDVWECVFGDSKKTIDFRIVLDDGLPLTHRKHRNFLVSIKKLLCLQTHPITTGSVVVSSKTALQRVSIALHVLDYFFLRSAQFQIAQYGFGLVTANEIVTFADRLTEDRNLKERIYEPRLWILNHLCNVTVDDSDLESARLIYPDLFNLDDVTELALPRQQILVARVWLMMNGFYLSGGKGSTAEYYRTFSRTRLLDEIIGSRILVKPKFNEIPLPGLDVTPSRWYQQELLAVPTTNLEEDERASANYVSSYLSVIRCMARKGNHGLELIPTSALAGLEVADILLTEKAKESSRFTTIPFSVGNQLLSGAIAFYLEYGEAIVDYYLSLAKDGRDPRTLGVAVPEKLRLLGLVNWRSTANNPTDFFCELRQGKNLHNLLEVLWGAIAVIVNSLVARRLAELEDLTAASIVDKNGSYFLAFKHRKENVVDFRKASLRPMPTIAAEALKLLARVSRELRDLEYPNSGKLFEVPLSAWTGSLPYYGTCQPDFSRCFNRFCDYIETEVDEHGRRYYVRAHQLRRNFAMLFFWRGSHGGVEVLRYFLGHSKPAMTYRYVTEAVTGKVLSRVKATIAKDLIKVDHSATEALAKFICDRYSLTLNELHILPDRDVVNYVEDLMASGEAEIEPEFFTGLSGEEYRILYKVKRAS